MYACIFTKSFLLYKYFTRILLTNQEEVFATHKPRRGFFKTLIFVEHLSLTVHFYFEQAVIYLG